MTLVQLGTALVHREDVAALVVYRGGPECVVQLRNGAELDTGIDANTATNILMPPKGD